MSKSNSNVQWKLIPGTQTLVWKRTLLKGFDVLGWNSKEREELEYKKSIQPPLPYIVWNSLY